MENSTWSFAHCDDDQKRLCSEYLISLGSGQLVKLINGTAYVIALLGIILLRANQEFIDRIFERVRLTERDLMNVASKMDLACRPDKFISLLKRMTNRNYQRDAFANAVFALFKANKTKCVDALLSALENATFLDQAVKDVAIIDVFYQTSKFSNDPRASYAKRYHNHPTISAYYYSNAIYRSYRYGSPNYELFNWLLEKADHEDLKAVKSDNEFSTNSEKFQNAIEKALKTTVPEKANRQDPARAKLTRKFLNEITGTSLGTRELGDIITAYLIGDETVGRVRK